MKRKVLYALALLLFLSTVALSNERARFRCRTAGNLPCPSTCTNTGTGAKASANASANAGANPDTATPSATIGESHVLWHTLIKLLYI